MENNNLQSLLAKIDQAAKSGNFQLAEAYAEQARRVSPDYNPANAKNISDKGAPITTRMLVGASAPEDRLTNLRRHYPEAMPYGDDNYVFFDREEGRPTIFNPEGVFRMDTLTGDVAENFGVVPEVAGGIGGFLLTSPSAPTGVPFLTGGLGATVAGQSYDASVRNLLGGTDSRDFGEFMGDAAEELVWNSLPIPEALKKVGSTIAPPVRNFLTTSNEKVMDVLNKYDIQPTLGVVGNKAMGMLDAVQQKAVGAVDTWHKAYDDMLEGFGRMVDDFQTALGGKATPTSAGQQLLKKGQNYQTQFLDSSQQMSDELTALIPEGTMINAPQTISFLSQYLDSFRNDPAIGKIVASTKLTDLAGAFADQNNEISYQALSALRTRIGQAIKNNDTIGDTTQGELKQLYKFLTQDKFNAATKMGGEIGQKARLFNDHYKAGMDIIDEFVTPLMMNSGKWVDPDEVYKRVSSLTNKPTTAAKLKSTGLLDESDFNTTASALLDDIGRATPAGQNAAGDQLSPSRVLSQTGKLSDEAAEQFLNQDARTIMNDMRVFAESVRDVERQVNRSNTGQYVQTGQLLTGGGGLLTTAATGDPMPLVSGVSTILLPYLSAKGLQSKGFTNWLRNAPKDGAKEATQEWIKAGRRIAINNGVQKVWDAFMDSTPDMNKSEGALAE